MDAVQILAEVGIHLKQWRRGQHYMRCPRCTTRKSDQHLSVLVTPEGHALWKCWRCGNFSGSTEALARKAEWERRTATPKVRDLPGPPPQPRDTSGGPGRPGASTQASRPVPEVKPVPPAPSPDVPGQVAFEPRHAAFWEALEPVTASCPVGRYLLGRGCPLPSAGDVKWHPDFRCWRAPNWRGPAMVGLITDVLTAAPMSFHFTWVRPDGHGKAPLERPRLLATGMRKQGGVIRLCDDADIGSWLMVGEGIETMLTMQKHTGLQPCWSCIDAGNFGRLPLPDWLRELVVVADHDKLNERTGFRPGLEAAAKLVERCARSGTVHKVRFAYPLRERTDFNDVGRALDDGGGGREAVA